MLTAKDEEVDKIVGLEIGADDYMTKPFSMRELMARIRAMLRRSGMVQSSGEATTLEINDLKIDQARHQAYLGDRKLELSPKEFDLLSFLARNRGFVFSREKILEKVWGYDYAELWIMEIRTAFHRKLREIQDDILVMGSMVGKAITNSVEALKDRDLKSAQKLIVDDKQVNRKRFEIEEKCIQLIATQQPMAGDLRTIMSAINVIAELERIGDHAEGIAKIVLMIGDEPPLKPLIDIPRMAEKTADMLHRSLDTFVRRDADKAREIVSEDDEVDQLYEQVFRELLTFMAEDPKTITRATRLIWVAHNLERSADRVTNICERVVYMVTGKIEEIGASKY
jgi:phosphate transport system protein